MASVEEYGALMRSQLGVRENPPDSNRVPYSAWYGYPAPWCQMFQNWAHAKLGMIPPGYDKNAAPKGTAYTPTAAAWFKARRRWSTRPQAGDLVYFDFPGDGVDRISHVGWVEAVNGDGSITTIEGNTDQAGGRTGGRVMRKNRRTGIVGYGRPDYQEAGRPNQEEDTLNAAQEKTLNDIKKRVDEIVGRQSTFGNLEQQRIAGAVDQLTTRFAGSVEAIKGAIAGMPTQGEIDYHAFADALAAKGIRMDPTELLDLLRANPLQVQFTGSGTAGPASQGGPA